MMEEGNEPTNECGSVKFSRLTRYCLRPGQRSSTTSNGLSSVHAARAMVELSCLFAFFVVVQKAGDNQGIINMIQCLIFAFWQRDPAPQTLTSIGGLSWQHDESHKLRRRPCESID